MGALPHCVPKTRLELEVCEVSGLVEHGHMRRIV